ncbi:MAG TPA: LptF/LptG family permease [Phycisphaerae bacterium]|nr:LptF/LptG family permease [Phycisphaerae bacterium]
MTTLKIKTLDRYIVKTFVVSLIIVFAAMMGLALVLDLFFNVNEFLEKSGSGDGATGFWAILGNVINYYFYKAFDYFQWLAAPSLLVAAAAALVRLNRGHELTGVKAAGISLYRVMWPMILMALLADGFYIVNQECIIPRIAVRLSRSPDDLAVTENFSVDFIRDEHNNIIYAPIYDPVKREMRAEARAVPDAGLVFMARVRIFLRDSKYQAQGTIEAERAVWDPKAEGWRLTGGVRLRPLEETTLPDEPPESEGEPWHFYATNVGPEEIERHRASDFHRYMSYGELKTLAGDPMRGNRRQLQVALHQHVTMPILNILVLLLGFPFVAGREERNYFVSIGITVLLFIGVYVLSFASTAFGSSGHISPLLAAWIPILVVLPASVLSMDSLRT